ncbi:276_t:CDS:1, partial [Funneliformis caledonium]
NCLLLSTIKHIQPTGQKTNWVWDNVDINISDDGYRHCQVLVEKNDKKNYL